MGLVDDPKDGKTDLIIGERNGNLNFYKGSSTNNIKLAYITDSLGWVYFKMHEYKEAVPYLEQAVELMPYDTTVNDHLGDAYWNVGRHREARFQWERAKNHSDDEQEVIALEKKITEGLPKILNKAPKEESNPKITAQSVPQ